MSWSTEITKKQAIAAWDAGNNHGLGYAPYRAEAGEDTVDEAVRCAEEDGWEVAFRCDDGLVVLRRPGGDKLMGIGDSYGAWAVDLVAGENVRQRLAQRQREEDELEERDL